MATYYVDYNRGSDSNDGLSPGAAWKEWTKIDDAAKSAGDAILFANDSIWEYDTTSRIVPPATWVGTQSQPVRIGKYSPLSAGTGKPTVRWNHKVTAGEWTYSAPNNAWQYTTSGAAGNQCLVRLGGTWNASRIDGTQLPLASIDGRYSNSGTTFSLYAPAGTDPTTYYGEVLLSYEQAFFVVTSGRGCVDIEDIRFEYTGTAILGNSSTAADVRLNVRRCDGQYVSNMIRAQGDTVGQLYMTVSGCNITEWGSSAIASIATGGAGIKGLSIYRNTITNGMRCYSQGAIYLQSRGTGLTTRVYENDISGVRWGTRDKTLDGCGIYAEVGSGGMEIYRNTIHDAVCAMQDNSGRGNKWYSNLVYDSKTAMRVSDGTSVGTTACEFFNNTCIVGTDKASYASFGAQPSEAGLRSYMPSGTMTSLLVKNNVFVNQGATQAAAILCPQVTPATTSYINNAASGGYTNVAALEFTPFTAQTSTGAVTADPLLASNYGPKSSSPLIGAGTHLGYRRDIARRQRPNPPSIGAYDGAPMRTI